MRTVYFFITVVLAASFTLTGCADNSKKLQAAYQAEKNGEIKKAAKIYLAVGRGAVPTVKFPDSKKSNILAPELWKDEVEKYLKMISEPDAKPNNFITAALEGLKRCTELGEGYNSAKINSPKLLDEKAFSEEFDKIFSPPPNGSPEWSGFAAFAAKKNFSVLQISSPVNYSYEVSVISGFAARRIDFSLYPENKLVIPLPPGDYGVIVKSSVTFQKGQYWSSDFSAFTVNIPAEPSFIAMDLRTKVARKQ